MNETTKREILKFVSAANPGDTRLVEIDGVVYRIEAVGRQSTSDDESKRCENCGLRGTLAPDADECPCLESCLVDDAYGAGLDFNVWRFYEKPPQTSSKGEKQMKNDTNFQFDETSLAPPKIRGIAAFAAMNYQEGFNEAKLKVLEALGKINFRAAFDDDAVDEGKTKIVAAAYDMVRLNLLDIFANIEPSKTYGGVFGQLDDEDDEDDAPESCRGEEGASQNDPAGPYGDVGEPGVPGVADEYSGTDKIAPDAFPFIADAARLAETFGKPNDESKNENEL